MKNYLRPMRAAQSRMRAEKPVQSSTAGTNSPHALLKTHKMLLLRRYASAFALGSGTSTRSCAAAGGALLCAIVAAGTDRTKTTSSVRAVTTPAARRAPDTRVRRRGPGRGGV